MNIVELRYLTANRLRRLCIECGWYVFGTNEEYGRLLDSLYDSNHEPIHLTTEKLYEIAIDIVKHSDPDLDVTNVMFSLADRCTTYFARME